ncbi:hemoglobin/transferrin/lactoferrin receptor protein [Cnuella takakiae]|uniref:Hemoglobin/transferrin/lactoferrin receptor protein n=1 Tax=Cnuella takakiae TaxID=1302690 RepID=A0A1M4T106_9BACT|nr:TonB-dependent receptor [Cnuella takakiae]SHE37947.1 hemoglobin/transferrin/lactoferrin receptor protein [Cnuella takakiae]
MMLNRCAPFFLAILLLAHCSLHAQNDTTVKNLDELVVRAQRTKQQKQKVPFSMEVLQLQALREAGARTTPEALAAVNGVFVQKTNHGGGSPFIRGLTGNQTLILVDGVRMNNAIFRYGPNQYLNTIDPFTIQQIEVAKGTGSVQYGSDALGGVIQVITTEPGYAANGKRIQGGVLGRLVNRDMEQTGRGQLQYSSQRVAIQAGVSVRRFGDLYGGDTTGRQSPSGYGEKAFDVKGKILLGSRAELTLAHQWVRQEDVPVYHKVKLENFALNNTALQQRSLSYAKLVVPSSKAWASELSVIASFQQGIEERESRKNGATTERHERDDVRTAGLTIDLASVVKLWWRINSGVEFYHDRVGSRTQDINLANGAAAGKRGLYPDGAGYGNYSLFSLHHFNYNRWTAELGVRYNSFAIGITDTTLGKVKLHPSSFVYNAGVLYQLGNRHSVFANFSTGYRAPNVDDMGTLGIVDFRYEVPAANLKPERSRNVELGYRYNAAALSFEASAYYLQLENLIARVQVPGKVVNGYNVYQKENVEQAYVKGAEASVRLRLLPTLSLQAGAAYAYGQNETRNEPLRRTPPFNGRMLLQYRKSGFHAAFELAAADRQDRLAKGDRDDNRIPIGGTPGWQVMNLYGGYRYKSVAFNAGLNNLANVDYRTHGSGINGMGRSVWCSLSVGM